MSIVGSRPVATNPVMIASLGNGKKLPARNAPISIPQYPQSIKNAKMLSICW